MCTQCACIGCTGEGTRDDLSTADRSGIDTGIIDWWEEPSTVGVDGGTSFTQVVWFSAARNVLTPLPFAKRPIE